PDARFVPQRAPHCLAERQGTVLHRVVLVDLQIAAAGELQGEAAVFGELLQHVIEEADARADLNGRRGVQIEGHLYVGLACLPVDPGRSCRQLAHERWPGLTRLTVLADAQSPDPEVAGELQIGVA